MKFDTKIAAKISSADCFLVHNRAIPTHAYEESRDDSNTRSLNGARQVMYHPSLVFTPVYASKRLVNQSKSTDPSNGNETTASVPSARRPLVPWLGVDDLVSCLETLSLSATTKPENNQDDGAVDDSPDNVSPGRDSHQTYASSSIHFTPKNVVPFTEGEILGRGEIVVAVTPLRRSPRFHGVSKGTKRAHF
jgi:hypothetical protein